MITKTIPISVRIIKSFQCKIALPFVFDLKEKSIETETTRTLLSNYSQNWCHGVVVITTAQLHSTKPELRFCTGSNPAWSVSEIHDGEDLWQWSWLKIRLNTFHQSTIPQQQFIIIIIFIIIINKPNLSLWVFPRITSYYLKK